MPVEMADASDSAHNSDPEQPKAESVSDIFASLMETFGRVLLKLDGDSEISDSPILEAAYEQCTRLKVWGLQNRVSAPNGAPGSLGELLKEQPEVEQLVFEVLRDANAWLSKILQGVEEGGAMVLGETSSRLEGDSDNSSTSSSDSSTAPGLVTYLKRTFENVGELYRLQSLLRKPRMKGKYLHSGQPRPDLPGYQQDYQHVRQRLDDWQRSFDSDADEQEKPESKAKPESHAEPDEDPGVSPDGLHQRQQAEETSQGLTDILCRRLASANSKRRKQLKYWQSHPYNHAPTQDISGGGLYQSQPAKRLPVSKGITKEAMTDKDAPMSEKVPTTVHSFSTAPRSAIMIAEKREAVDFNVARTTYQPSVVGTGPRTTMRVPDVPRITGGGEATKCPYCQVPLSSEILANRENWKRHVFRDLRPYVCTARSCTDPEKQFAARYDWIYHERQLHHRQWDCSECSEVFESRDAFLSHTYRSHGGDWTERQIAILASMRERAKDDTAWSDCPLCLSSTQHLKLFEHVAGHLEEISLFSLPRDAVSTEEDEGISNEAREDITRYSSESDRDSWSSDTSRTHAQLSLADRCFHEAELAETITKPLQTLANSSLAGTSFEGRSLSTYNRAIMMSVLDLRKLGDYMHMVATTVDPGISELLSVILPMYSECITNTKNTIDDTLLGFQQKFHKIYSEKQSPYNLMRIYHTQIEHLLALFARSPSPNTESSKDLREYVLKLCEEKGIPRPLTYPQSLEDIPDETSSKEQETDFHWVQMLYPVRSSQDYDRVTSQRAVSVAYGPFSRSVPGGSDESVPPKKLRILDRFQFNKWSLPLYVLVSLVSNEPLFCLRILQDGRPWYSTQWIHELSISRESGKTIILHRWSINQDQGEDWARLSFESTNETLVFHHMFIALKTQIPLTVGPITPAEMNIAEEGRLFQAAVHEDGHERIFQVHRDVYTKEIRFVAFEKERGKFCPAWMAFSNRTFHSEFPWVVRLAPRKVQLPEVRFLGFYNGSKDRIMPYILPFGAQDTYGSLEIEFDSEDDAIHLLELPGETE